MSTGDSDFTWSYRGAEEYLRENGLYEEVQQLPEVWDEYSGNDEYDERSQLLREIGDWEQSKRIRFSKNIPVLDKPRDAVFDAYKDGVAVEHESGEAMRAIWHMMKFEIAYRDASVFQDPDEDGLDVGILLIPEWASNPSGERARRDVLSILSKYFRFEVPLFVWEYSDDRE